MRVIRTDLYFQSEEVRRPLQRSVGSRNPGFAVAWFHDDGSKTALWSEVEGFVNLAPIDLEEIGGPTYEARAGSIPPLRITQFIDICLQSRTLVANARYERIYNERAVHEILGSPVIIQRSPLSEVPFAQIATSAANVTVGLYLGTHVVSSSDPLLFITIPGGIVVAGAAIGVSRRLMNGLNAAIEKAIEKITKSLL